jgi:hypothetical protein
MVVMKYGVNESQLVTFQTIDHLLGHEIMKVYCAVTCKHQLMCVCCQKMLKHPQKEFVTIESLRTGRWHMNISEWFTEAYA